MTNNGIQGSFSAHDKLTYVLNEAQKAGQKHATLLTWDEWQHAHYRPERLTRTTPFTQEGFAFDA